MFTRALKAYRAMVTARMDEAFSQPSLALAAGFFDALPEPGDGPEDPRNAGCLMVNMIAELSDPPAPVAAEIAAYREMWRAKFEACLMADGVAEAADKAEFLVGALWGMLTQIRFSRDKSACAPMARVTAQTIRGWAS